MVEFQGWLFSSFRISSYLSSRLAPSSPLSFVFLGFFLRPPQQSRFSIHKLEYIVAKHSDFKSSNFQSIILYGLSPGKLPSATSPHAIELGFCVCRICVASHRVASPLPSLSLVAQHSHHKLSRLASDSLEFLCSSLPTCRFCISDASAH